MNNSNAQILSCCHFELEDLKIKVTLPDFEDRYLRFSTRQKALRAYIKLSKAELQTYAEILDYLVGIKKV